MDGALKVLVVEDDVEQAGLVQKCFEAFNARFRVETISSGSNYVHKLSEETYEAVVIDYELHSANGPDVLHNIAKAHKHPPVIIVSGKESEQNAVAALQSGANDYLVKDDRYFAVLPKIVHQIIEKHQLQERLLRSELKYRSIFERTSDAIAIVAPADFRIVEANQRLAELLGHNLGSVVGSSFHLLFPADYQNKVQALLTDVQTQGEKRDDNLMIVSPHPEPIPVELTLRTIELDQMHLLCNIRNISDKQNLQRLILNSKRRLQSTFDGITDIIFQVNEDFEIIIANRQFAQYANMKPEDVVGRRYSELLCDRGEPCDDCPVVRTTRTLEPCSVEKTRNGLITELWSYPIFDEVDKLESIAVYCKNITEKKQLEKTLIQSEKLSTIGLLASGIAHELRNPLNVIETARYYINEFLAQKDPDITAKLEIIRSNVQRSSKIINNLLEFSRQSEHTRETIDLRAILETTISLVKKELDAQNIDLVLNADRSCLAYFSINSLKQVVLNLLINAIQAMPAGGRLIIALGETTDGWVDIKISDTGSGIAAEHLPHIFSPFFTTKNAGEGTGLGLYITHMIIERDGGKISVESQEGLGTTFMISLPTKAR